MSFFSKTVFRFGFYVLKLAEIHLFAIFQVFWDFREFRGPKVKWTTSYATATRVFGLPGHAYEKLRTSVMFFC